MVDLECLVCHQTLDDKKLLQAHLKDNPSHRRSVKKNAKTQLAKSQRVAKQPDRRRSSTLPATVNPGTSEIRGVEAQRSWLQLTAEQILHLYEVIPIHCHSPELLLQCHYHLANRSFMELEKRQKCVVCKKKRSESKGEDKGCKGQKKSRFKRKARRQAEVNSVPQELQPLVEHTYAPVIPDDYEVTPRQAMTHTVSSSPQRLAVAIDCEMVGTAGGGSELARICAVDLLTGEILINSLVQPNGQVTDWRTRWSGVTASAMLDAVTNGKALLGWRAARQVLWEHIDSSTVLIGHSLENDLTALHMIHTKVIDTAIVTRIVVDPTCKRTWGLKTLCADLMNLTIQNGGRDGHDCLEDTLAVREVFLSCILDSQNLAQWAAKERVEEQEKARRQQIARLARINAQASGEKSNKSSPKIQVEDSDSEILHWSDIAEDLGWPHPDTGYDPWSD